MKANPTVVAVLRSGGEYLPGHAMELMVGVEKYWPKDRPLRRVLLTDMGVHIEGVEEGPFHHPWKKWWCKLELFRPDMEQFGDLLFFDLDTVILGDLSDIADVKVLTMLEDFYRPNQAASGLMYLPQEMRAHVWEQWIANPAEHIRRYRGDQEFLRPLIGEQTEFWQRLLPGQVVSYKVHVQKGQHGPDTRVVCFHGRPKPWHVKKLDTNS